MSRYPAACRFHARAGAPGLRVSGGRGVVLDGLTFFAATLRAQQSPGLRVSNCSFLYSAASRAAAGNLSAPASNALLGCDRARVEDCTFRSRRSLVFSGFRTHGA